MASIEWIVAIAITMVSLLLLANLVVVKYAAAAVTASAAAGARAGARLGGEPAECEAAALGTLRGATGLLRGSIGSTSQAACSHTNGYATATVTVDVPWFFGDLPPVHLEHSERRQLELAP